MAGPEDREIQDDVDYVAEVIAKFGKGAAHGFGKWLIRAGNAMTGHELTQDAARKMLLELKRREDYFAEAEKRGEHRYITTMKWITAEYDRMRADKAKPPEPPPPAA
ncbi:MAG: hypothetical protein NTU97_03760 [Candidatus Magasanikbacteria bacterium]|nr:hypothetical protein [Candidatus Magasanikbacteria bacterium]